MSISAITSSDDLSALARLLQGSKQAAQSGSGTQTSFDQALEQLAASGSTSAGGAPSVSSLLGDLIQALKPEAATTANSSGGVTPPADAGTLPATQVGSVIDQQLDGGTYTANDPLVVHSQAAQGTAPFLGSQEQANAYQQGSLLYTVTTPDGETSGYGGAHASAAAFTKAAAGSGAVLKTDQHGSYYQAVDGKQYRL